MTVNSVEGLVTALNQPPPFSHYRRRQRFLSSCLLGVSCSWCGAYLDHQVADGEGADGSTLVESSQDHVRNGAEGITVANTYFDSFNGPVHFIHSTIVRNHSFELKVTESVRT